MSRRATFLKRVAEHYYNLYKEDIANYCFVFPSKLALVFFQNYLQEQVERPIFAPQLYTINDFICEQVSDLKVLDETALLFELYRCYRELREELGREAKSFDDFLFWGRLILKDFDKLDRFLVNVDDLFSNLAEYKGLDDDFDYLDDESKKLIQDFWKGFELNVGERHGEGVQNFIDFWEELPLLYAKLNQALSKQKSCYEGGIYRLLADKAEVFAEQLAERETVKQYIFVGLFGLSKAEWIFLKALKSINLAEFVWDEDVELLKDVRNPATKVLAKDKEGLGQLTNFLLDEEQSFLPEEVEVLRAVSAISQAKSLPQVLDEIKNLEQDRKDLNKAIILPNEKLLLPVVSSIPASYDRLNISIGYPLSGTPVAIMLGKWKELLLISRDGSYYPADKLVSLLSSELISEFVPELQRLMTKIYQETKFYYTQDELLDLCLGDNLHKLDFAQQISLANEVFDDTLSDEKINEYRKVFALNNSSLQEVQMHILRRAVVWTLISAKSSADDFLNALILLLNAIYTLSSLQKEERNAIFPEEEGFLVFEEQEATGEGQLSSFELNSFDEEFIYHYIRLAKRLLSLMDYYKDSISFLTLKSCIGILERLVYTIKIPFEGNPLEGLQVLGILESRTLNFEYLIYLSASEGSLPSLPSQSSLIPYTLQVGFGLPTREEQDAVSAYQFYQTIAKCKKLILLCGEDDEFGGKGEESRYVKQLRYHYNLQIKERIVEAVPYKEEPRAEIVGKKPLENKLACFLDGGDKTLSISKLLVYARCPLDFYYKAVERVEDTQLPDALSSPKVFGDILHETMELIYKPYIGTEVPKAEILGLIGEKGHHRIKKIILSNKYYQGRSKHKSYWKDLEVDTLLESILNILRFDVLSTFIYLGSEIKMELAIPIKFKGEERQVNFVGYIDRCDLLIEEDGTRKLRVLDYKTGSDRLEDISVKDFNEFYERVLREKNAKKKAMVQTLFYSLMVLQGKIVQNSEKPEALSKYQTEIKHKEIEIYPALLLTREISKLGSDFSPYLTINESKEVKSQHFSQGIESKLTEALTSLLEELFDFSKPFEARAEGDSCKYCLHN